MHNSLEMKEYMIHKIEKQTDKSCIESYYVDWIRELFFVATIVSQVGYGSNSSLPNIGPLQQDYSTLLIMMLTSLIIFQFLQGHLAFFMMNNTTPEIE